MSIKEFVKAETERLGFSLFGVTDIQPPAHYETYSRWLENGLHAGMGYLAAEPARTRRGRPASLLPGALSMVVAALRYPKPLPIEVQPSADALGRVASYAWGVDYHEIIPPLLRELVEALQKYLGKEIHARPYTDTGPILERDFAQRAGLGWAGKNTCLISPRQGSYFLIGETFIDVEIEPDPPFQADQCGTCRRCITACPTTAIRDDRTIDSGRCISYLTIENKGSIPAELRPGVGDWVFGCDICQMVCPWNIRFATESSHPGLKADPENARPVLRNELSLTPQQFNQKFRHSPLLRAKRRGYLRNISVALGNQKDTSAAPQLAEILHNEPEPLVRGHAAWALGQLRTQGARMILDQALLRESDPDVLSEIRSALDEK
jgi:epoxyqueuosine reductase